ncbi:alpha/beta hydrolase [Caulobacter sp. NIBR2454]|uniref:alpha/beta hydrolase n=1 Tax=Caulobacter sp. NIBR2454 TaxID=3015996 RepID=UPI0022B6FA7D|nr:alpha/beta hydrolase [Caulobacter sp. NIBR2454]
MTPRSNLRRACAALPLALAITTGWPGLSGAQTAPPPYKPDGTVLLSGEVPPSNLLSKEGADYLRHLIVDKPFGSGPPLADIKAERARQDAIMRVFLDPMRRRYAVNVAEETIGGVLVDVVTPADGVSPENRDRVLINLHGGGFVTGARSASLVESVPLAALMRIKVISIDYRMGPEYQFPAASQDVAAVYRQVLKTHDAKRVGLYGCSAGGTLAAQSIAWFQSHDLPNPAAVGVFCSSLGQMVAGDSAHLAGGLLGSGPRRAPPPAASASPPAPRAPTYMGDARRDDPLAYPEVSRDVLARFPPTLLISGTRSFEFSAALNSHNKLTAAGVQSQFHGWDGLFHAFIYNSELPESREAYDIMVRFFDTHLAK